MIVLIDGKEVEVKNDVKVIVPVVDIFNDAATGELHVTLTYEGLILDYISPGSEEILTYGATYAEQLDSIWPGDEDD